MLKILVFISLVLFTGCYANSDYGYQPPHRSPDFQGYDFGENNLSLNPYSNPLDVELMSRDQEDRIEALESK